MVTISVVIPSYNDACFLAAALDALAAQLRPADEIVVVDNGRPMTRPTSRAPRALVSSSNRCAESGPRPRRAMTRHPAI